MEKVKLITLKINTDNRGSLIAIENNKEINFDIKRIFYMFDMKQGIVRAKHANRYTKMCLSAIKGNCKILVDNGIEKETFYLNNSEKALMCDPMTWKEIYDISSDCILLVICDTIFDPNEYIEDYNDFITEVKKIKMDEL